jgi:hypothetical protein
MSEKMKARRESLSDDTYARVQRVNPRSNPDVKSVGIRLSPEEYQRVNEMADLQNTSITAFIAGCVSASIEIIEAAPNKPINLPQYFAVARMVHHWDNAKEDQDKIVD